MKNNTLSYVAKDRADYERLSLKRDSYESWEDSMRTNGGKGSYEWWYFDAQLNDGSKMVIVFYTKPMTDVNKPIKPYATLNIDYADGTKMERYLPSDDFFASNETCEVRIGRCFLRGNLTEYKIHMEDDHGFNLEATFLSSSQSWRPETGHFYFGDERNTFSWFVAIPKGKTTVRYSVNGTQKESTGVCYHDHNWGNKGLHKLVNHWYWSRSDFGPYTVIACQIVPEKKYGLEPINVIYVAKNGEIITADASKMEFHKNKPVMGMIVKKPVSDDVMFKYADNGLSIELRLKRKTNILETYLIQQEPKRKLIKLLTGFNGGYFRITGEARLEIRQNDVPDIVCENDHAIWELMFFGKPFELK
jgi:hypothetical protein